MIIIGVGRPLECMIKQFKQRMHFLHTSFLIAMMDAFLVFFVSHFFASGSDPQLWRCAFWVFQVDKYVKASHLSWLM